jgi:RNA polymerase sigma-70 factor, ECF subfamily
MKRRPARNICVAKNQMKPFPSETDSRCNREFGTTGSNPVWAGIVERVRSGDPSGMEDLYRSFYPGIRYFLCRQIGFQDLDDKIHNILVIVVQSIRRGELRDPERLGGYIRTIAQRQAASHINGAVQARRNRDIDSTIGLSDHQPSPEWQVIDHENADVAMRLLRSLKRRDREVLIRFYLKEESQEQICGEMGLTETQFRLIKSRAKARFAELGKARFAVRKNCGRSPANWPGTFARMA